ncbi:ankyrin repeat [Fusarium albosuccineum]|uniref:Ankyrin repeat n=1 Tax=Fusarium albosuccineum TaxID=1237068 RepID=A0A8H4LAB6_9HYPO|nr:ankyrin repeat [Fusarium albosuccineum]
MDPSRPTFQKTALQTAVLHNNEPAVKCLLQYNADPNAFVRFSEYPLSMAVDMCRSSITQALIHAGANVNLTDPVKGYKTPLLWAIQKHDVALVHLLLQAGADPNLMNEKCLSPLHLAIFLGHATIVGELTEAGANPNLFVEGETLRALMKGFYGVSVTRDRYFMIPPRTPLQEAAERGDLGIVKCLVKAGATPNGVIDLNTYDETSGYQDSRPVVETPLGIAVGEESYKMVKFLLQAGADVNFQSSMLLSPLQSACGLQTSGKKSKIVRLLLNWGAEIDVPPSPEGGRTALQAAAEVGDYDLAKDLLLRGASLDIPAAENEGITVLEAAMRSGCVDLVELLLRSLQPNLDVQNCWRSGLRHLEAAVASGNAQLLQMLLETMFSLGDLGMEKYGVQAFEAAITIGSLSAVQRLFKVGADINAKRTACSILCTAISKGDVEIINLLIYKFVDLDLSLDDALPGEETPLWTALINKDGDTMKRLIEAGANRQEQIQTVTVVDNIHLSYVLSWGGRESAAKILLAYGADPNKRRLSNGTATLDLLFWLRNTGGQKSVFPMAKLLVDHGLDVTAPSASGFPLQQAIENYGGRFRSELIQICQLLLDAGADVNAPPKSDVPMTALQCAIVQKAEELINMFLNAGADIHAPAFPDRGKTALQAASSTGNLHLVKKLVTQGADVNAEPAEHHGATALQFAAIGGHINVAIYLLENGALINTPAARREGRTALQGAAEHGRLDMIYLMLENDDDAETVEERCQDAAKFAEAKFYPVIAATLREYKRPW